MSSETTPNPASAAAPPPRSARQTLGQMVLSFEVLVVFLATLVIWGLAPTENSSWGLPPWVALVAGGVLILGLIVTIGLLRFPWGFWLGSALQVVIIASGFLNPAMFFVGAIFGGMWWYGMHAGARIDRTRTATADPRKEPQE